ncbi:MAG TPA: hypothetical protein PKL11_07335 [Anaerolineaceae bacterium]|nr:hypothetical protein [Anaerolineaceae bacterium]
MGNLDLLWTLIGFLLTLMVFSYLFGDNPVFRLASYLLVGVGAGYTAVVLIFEVIIPRLGAPLLSGDLTRQVLAGVPIILGLLLLTKLSPRLSSLGNVSMAYLVGAGAGAAVGGAIFGTLFQQIGAAIAPFGMDGPNPFGQLLQGVLMVIGAAATLLYFHFSARPRPDGAPRRSPLIETGAKIGEVFIGLTLGALFAGVMASALTALLERLNFLIQTILNLF